MMADTYVVTKAYADGTKKMLETPVGSTAMQEAGSYCREADEWSDESEKQAKTVTLTKNGEAIFSQKIPAYVSKKKDAKGS